MIQGEIAMAKDVRAALDSAGQNHTILYAECLPVDTAAPYFDALFDYSLPASQPTSYDVKLNLWRFAFPATRRWDMLTAGVEPHLLSAEDFRLAVWNGDGAWLKGRSDTWYGTTILAQLRHQRPFLLAHAAAFSGQAEPMVSSPDPRVLINCFSTPNDTVYTLFNRSYGTVHVHFRGTDLTIAPRDVAMLDLAGGATQVWNDNQTAASRSHAR